MPGTNERLALEQTADRPPFPRARPAICREPRPNPCRGSSFVSVASRRITALASSGPVSRFWHPARRPNDGFDLLASSELVGRIFKANP
jgi:hypothetical protein